MKNKRTKIIIYAILIILLLPLVAMQFTDEVNWNFLDFKVAAALLLGTAFMCEFVISTKTQITNCLMYGYFSCTSAYLGRTCGWDFSLKTIKRAFYFE